MTNFSENEIECLKIDATDEDIIGSTHPVISRSDPSVQKLIKAILPLHGVIDGVSGVLFGYYGRKETMDFIFVTAAKTDPSDVQVARFNEYFKEHMPVDNHMRITAKCILKEIADVRWIRCRAEPKYLIFSVVAGKQPVHIAVGFKH